MLSDQKTTLHLLSFPLQALSLYPAGLSDPRSACNTPVILVARENLKHIQTNHDPIVYCVVQLPGHQRAECPGPRCHGEKEMKG